MCEYSYHIDAAISRSYDVNTCAMILLDKLIYRADVFITFCNVTGITVLILSSLIYSILTRQLFYPRKEYTVNVPILAQANFHQIAYVAFFV